MPRRPQRVSHLGVLSQDTGPSLLLWTARDRERAGDSLTLSPSETRDHGIRQKTKQKTIWDLSNEKCRRWCFITHSERRGLAAPSGRAGGSMRGLLGVIKHNWTRPSWRRPGACDSMSHVNLKMPTTTALRTQSQQKMELLLILPRLIKV